MPANTISSRSNFFIEIPVCDSSDSIIQAISFFLSFRCFQGEIWLNRIFLIREVSLTMRESRCNGVICGRIGDQIKLRQFHILRYSDLSRAVPLVDYVACRVANCKRINFAVAKELTCRSNNGWQSKYAWSFLPWPFKYA